MDTVIRVLAAQAGFWTAVACGYAVFSIAERIYPAKKPAFPMTSLKASVLFLALSPIAAAFFAPAVSSVRSLLAFWEPMPLNMLALAYHFDGATNPVGYVPSIAAGLLFTLVSLLVFDFFYYWFHRLQHSSFLWEFHKLHHSDEHMCVITSYRHHWLEESLRLLLMLMPLSLIFRFNFLQTAVGSFLIAQWGMFIHSNLRVNLGPLTPVFVGPQQHRIHHSIEERHRNKNFGQFFPVWDILFGTYCAPENDEFPDTGVVNSSSEQSLLEIITLPDLRGRQWKRLRREA